MNETQIIQEMLGNAKLRRAITGQNFYLFFSLYFGGHMEYPLAEFQREMMALAENKWIQNVVIAGFRNSAKSTILSLAFPIWAVLGEHQIKHILIASKTQHKAQQILQHIKDMLGPDSLLKKDLGPFQEVKSQWNMSSIVLKRHNARISVISTEQSIRGIRHESFRPQLIILDDIEDIESVRTQESRDKLYEWLTREVIPAGDLHTRMIMIGNKLHEDSIMMRLQKAIASGEMAGVYRNYPALIDGVPLWPGKYADQAAVEAERLRGMPEIAYRREILLEIIPEGYGIIKKENLHFYDSSTTFPDYRFSLIAIDPAAKTRPENDCTAIVSADVYGSGRTLKIRIRPNPVNARLTYQEVVDRTAQLVDSMGGSTPPRVCVEDVGFQHMFLPFLQEQGIVAEGVSVRGKSKEDRLNAAAIHFENGTVEFPENGIEQLLNQVLYFGSSDHDDLVDALSLLILKVIELVGKEPGFVQIAREELKRNSNGDRGEPPKTMGDWFQAARRGRF